ncbi:hypothetical protein [Mucilaginibacter sp. KACC 22063]|uniref:hypothetical protein n=1 Tax=Mucilaginibacter sp. KACC 22063 TaxID=3025666 RepID=UPI002367311C|nr:hypothetical protein [Mucilaginibacter sp. KACC 22063]WDF54336.1 hypothetical protein PQ461_15435 [Mucilaginibacter sp. KACC 22063]
MKASKIELDLHILVSNGDSLALTKLYDLCGDHIINLLSARYPGVAKQDDAQLYDAVNQAFFGYHRNPGTFDPEKSTLQRFLEIAAERDLKNILEKEARHGKKKNLPDDVELEEKFWNSIVKEQQQPENLLIKKETINLIDLELANHFDSTTDRVLASMIIAGERETRAYAAVLQISELTAAEQQDEVKRVKDRIKKVLERKDVEDKIKQFLK